MTKPDILVVSRPSYRGGTMVIDMATGLPLKTGLGAISAHVFISALVANAGRPLVVAYNAFAADADRQYAKVFREGAQLGKAIARRKANEEVMDHYRRTLLESMEEFLEEIDPVVQVTVIDVVRVPCNNANCEDCRPVQRNGGETIPDANRYRTEPQRGRRA